MPVFIDVRCPSCGRLMCRADEDLNREVQMKCRHCRVVVAFRDPRTPRLLVELRTGTR